MREFFDGGRRWRRGELVDDDGKRCNVGALRHIRATPRIRADEAAHYLRRAISPIWRLI
jgi:hypothetical protein